MDAQLHHSMFVPPMHYTLPFEVFILCCWRRCARTVWRNLYRITSSKKTQRKYAIVTDMRILAPGFYQSMFTAETFLFRSTNTWYEVSKSIVKLVALQNGNMKCARNGGRLFNAKIIIINSIIASSLGAFCVPSNLHRFIHILYVTIVCHFPRFHCTPFVTIFLWINCKMREASTHSHYSHIQSVVFNRHLYVFCDDFET